MHLCLLVMFFVTMNLIAKISTHIQAHTNITWLIMLQSNLWLVAAALIKATGIDSLYFRHMMHTLCWDQVADYATIQLLTNCDRKNGIKITILRCDMKGCFTKSWGSLGVILLQGAMNLSLFSMQSINIVETRVTPFFGSRSTHFAMPWMVCCWNSVLTIARRGRTPDRPWISAGVIRCNLIK